MKKLNRFLTGLFAMCIIAGCSDDSVTDDGTGNGIDNPKDAAYLSVSVSLPSKGAGTRSGTGVNGGLSNGTEVGTDSENAVGKILLVLADNENKYGAHAVVEKLPELVNGKMSKVTAKIDRTKIQNFYDPVSGELKTGLKKGINVYVFCNPTGELLIKVGSLSSGDAWVDETCKVKEDKNTNTNTEIWNANSFLMSNASSALRRIPETFDAWPTKYATENTAFDLSGINDGGAGIDNSETQGGGQIKVERSVARFDFRDGSPDNTDANTYNIGLGDQAGMLKVKLCRMALVNMSNEFYYLRRVSNDGTPDGEAFGICGLENNANYVVDTDWKFKNKTSLDKTALHDHFNYPLFDIDGGITAITRQKWNNYRIKNVLAGGSGTDLKYKIWRYVTENTIPAPAARQKNGVSTGIVFKGKLIVTAELDGGEDNSLYKASKGLYELPQNTDDYTDKIGTATYPVLYLFRNAIYVGWNAEVMQVTSEENPALHEAATKVPEKFSKSPNELYNEYIKAADAEKPAAFNAFRKAAVAAGFTLYQASDDQASDSSTDKNENDGPGYYFYYYYWNRHNDNGKPGTMNPMEFAVVRNNVYKLAVTEIKKLGHPRITDNDPDPVDPEKPDEQAEVYLTVSVEVLPWVVRVNNIDF